jgi:hypothetical protein
MDTMIAYRLLNAQTQPEFQEVPEPHAAPGHVFLVWVGYIWFVLVRNSLLLPHAEYNWIEVARELS